MQVWGSRQATLCLNALYDTFERIARLPEIGRQRTGRGRPQRPARAHVIFYRPWEGEVAIVRVLHGSRDVESVFRAPFPPEGWSDEAG
jgi:toxin ParE1/3/4